MSRGGEPGQGALRRIFATLGLAALSLVAPAAGADAAPGPRFLAAAGQVHDRLTGLVWQRCSVGQRWDGEWGCVGVAKKVWFAEAGQFENAEWRLPSLAELRTLFDPTLVSIADTTAFPDAPATGYWAVGEGGTAIVWGVSCAPEREDSCYRGDARALRLVRRARSIEAERVEQVQGRRGAGLGAH